MRPGRCIALRGGGQDSRLACAISIARACAGAGGVTVSFAGIWNSTGDPDPYNSYPFSCLTLVAPEARLTYVRPGADPASFDDYAAIPADLVLVDLPGSGLPWVALDESEASGGCLASWGFDSPGLPRLDGLAPGVMLHVLGAAAGTAVRTRRSAPIGGVRLWIGETPIPLSGYPGRVVSEVVMALVGTLHGAGAKGDVRIEVDRPERWSQGGPALK